MQHYVLPFVACLGVIALVSTPAAGRAAQSSSTSPPAVVTQRAVYVCEPPDKVAVGVIRAWSAAPRGRYLLALQEESESPVLPEGLTGRELLPPERRAQNLVIYDARRHRARQVWQFKPDPSLIYAQFRLRGWFSNSDVALVSVALGRVVTTDGGGAGAQGETREKYENHLLLVDASSEQARLVPLGDSAMFPSPSQPLAVLQIRGPSEDTILWKGFKILKPDGSISAPVMFPPQLEDKKTIAMRWNEDGTGLYLGALSTGERREESFWLLDPVTQKVTPVPKPAFGPRPQEPSRQEVLLTARTTSATLTEKETKVQLSPLWLETNWTDIPKSEKRFSRALIASDADATILLTDASAVLYQKHGALYAAPLRKLDKAAYLAARREAEKQITIKNAKQIGMGIFMYAQSHDWALPPAAGDIVKMLGPYIKDPSVFEDVSTGTFGFSYLFNGEARPEGVAAKTTPVGYLSGAGGRAIVYADGHVEWEDTKEDAP